jgi:UDP-N-acetylglucosamine acyltransferase
MTKIHPTAIVSPKAEIGPECEIGPYAVIEEDVVLGPGNKVLAHGVVCSGTRMGTGNEVHYHAVVGHVPQHKHFDGKPTKTIIGNGNIFREGCQVHRGTGDDSDTIIGDRCLVMALAHIAHDCKVGDDVVICNNTLVAGHVLIGDRAVLSGNVAIHQFAQIGTMAMVGGGSSVARDIPPYMMAVGNRPCLVTGLNIVGLRRAGITNEARATLAQAFRILYRSGLLLPDALARIADLGTAETQHLAAFVKRSTRGILSHGRYDDDDTEETESGEAAQSD